MIAIQEAFQYITGQARSFGTERVSIDDAFGRVLAQDIVADRDYPPFNRSTMDGYALQSADLLEKRITHFELLESLHAGGVASQEVRPGTCIKIMTGAPVPAGADAVIRVEDSLPDGRKISFQSSVKPGQNIARQGEDARGGDLLIRKNQWIDAPIISVLAVTGTVQVEVKKLPQVAILSTGNEIKYPGEPVLPHQIRDSNSFAIKSFFKHFQVISPEIALVPDDKNLLKDTLLKFLHKDIIILSGGVSKGDADYVPEVLMSLGVKQIFHRIKIKPGAPLWFGVTPTGGAVFGLPGNPVSVQVACRLFIEAYLCTCLGVKLRSSVILPFLADKAKKTKFDEYFPSQIVPSSPVSGLQPMRYNTSGDIAATLGSDGIALHPENIEILKANTPVEFYFW